MNILNFDFIRTKFRNNLLEIPDGVRCEGNTKSGLPHPVYYNMRVFSYSARVKSSTWKRHQIIHGFVDVNRKLHRLDYKPWRSTSSTERTIIFSGREGLAYDVSHSGGCSVGNITDVVFDKQMILRQSPPFYNGSFRAIGEIIRMRPSDDSAFTVKEVLFFEEIYDSTNLKAALRIHSSNETFTYFQDIETRQTFLHTSSARNATCDLIKTNSDIFGPLETKDGWHYFYLRDLLTSTHWNTTPDEAHYPARNMSCDVWVTEAERNGRPLIIAMAVYSRSWGSITGTMQAPVSVRTRYTNSEDDDEIEINIFEFGAFGDHIHDDLLQLPDGVFCGGYKKAVSLPPLRDMRIFNYRVEMTSSGDNATHYSDTVKRGIPCHMWEVLRTDWPPESDGFSTLWEWCFVVPKGEEGKRSSGNTYMVSLDITVLQVPSGDENSLSLKEGTRLSYHFYDSFKNPPELIDLHGFDISPCYKGNDSVDAYLEVKLSPSDYSTLSSVSTLNDPKFLSAWRKALDEASSLSDHSLRITRVKGYFSEDDTLFVTFILLDRFPADAKVNIEDTQVDLEGMQDNLNKSVNEGSLGITYKGPMSPTTTWVIFTKPEVTDEEPHVWDTTTSTYDITTALPEAYSTIATRYSPGVVGGTTAGLFLLGALIGASATYVKSAFFSTASLPTTVFH
ncbi:hypothetical protein MTO96_025491 [Rhipicephalus appendiculatus]